MAKISVIGAAGDVGALILPALASRHEVTVADLRRPAGWDGTFVHADATIPADMIAACRGSEIVVYLAMGTKQGWGEAEWAASQFTVNVSGLYQCARAAAEVGARKLIHTSTASIFEDYLSPSRPAEPDAFDAYGLSKRLGERVCAAAVSEHGIDAISLRLVGPMPDQEWQQYKDDTTATVVTAGSDIAAAYLAAIEADLPGYHALFVSGDHEHSIVDSRETEQLLGWRPLARRIPQERE